MATVPRPPLYSPRLTVAFPYRAIFDEPQNRLLNLLKSKDTQFGAPGDWQTYDYPNPRGPVYNITLRTWTDSFKLELLGKDKFFGAPGQPPDYDWQNPIRRAAMAPWRETYSNLLETTLGGVTRAPFAATDWPNPTGRVYPVALRTFFDPLKIPLLVPFHLLDWQNPTGRPFPVDFRTFLNPIELQLQGQDRFFGAAGQPPANLDWPNPLVRLRAQQDGNVGLDANSLPAPDVPPPPVVTVEYIPCFRPRRR